MRLHIITSIEILTKMRGLGKEEFCYSASVINLGQQPSPFSLGLGLQLCYWLAWP